MSKEKEERPSVQVVANTVNTIHINIVTKNGTCQLHVGQDGVIVHPQNMEVEVRP